MDIEDIVEKLSEHARRANVEVIFGETRQFEDRAVIPVGKVAYGFGTGGGKGPVPETAAESGAGEGGGGGLGVTVKPVGYILVTKDDILFRPITDMSMVVMAGMAVGVVFMLAIKSAAKAMARCA